MQMDRKQPVFFQSELIYVLALQFILQQPVIHRNY